MIRPNNQKLTDKYGPVKGVPGATNKPLPPVYKQSPAYMGPFVQGANQQSRMMGWDGVKEQPRQRNPAADGVAPAQMINPLGKVGGGGALPSMVSKQRPPAQRPVQATQTTYQPQQTQFQQQPQYQPQPSQRQQPQQTQSMQNFIQPLNQPAARVPTSAPQPQPSKQPLRSTGQQPRQMSQIQPPQSAQQPLRQAPVQQAPPPNAQIAQIELLKKEVNELKLQVESMKDNTEQIYELQDSLGKLINKVDSIEWDSYSFEADIAVASGVGVWEELPADSIDVHVDNIQRNTSSSTSDKIFKEGEHIRIHYPLAEFNVEMHDGSVQKWRFARTRIFKSEGWLLDDVFFPLEISAAFLPGGADSDPQNPDFSLVTTVSNIKV